MIWQHISAKKRNIIGCRVGRREIRGSTMIGNFGRTVAALCAVVALAGMGGCSYPTRSDAVPAAQYANASLPGVSNIRYFAGNLETMIADGQESVVRERAALAAAGHRGPLPPAHFLAISGGGENGAFGAGLLAGWSAAGTRPEFKLVTGVSTGALTAPFAFLGSKYDPQLKEVYTTISSKDVLQERSFLAAVFDDALTDNKPLRALIARHVTRAMLDEIAVEHRKGRILLIGTADLDARRGVIWNIGKIAESGSPRALELVHDILVASAAIPGAFPPVMIDVDVAGQRHQEMHVDGGTVAQVFIYPPQLHVGDSGIQRERKAYIIRNARLDPDWAQVERQTLSIATRAITSLIHTQGLGDLYRIYLTTQRDGVDYNLAFIPASFTRELKEPFERAYMTDLFQVGYDMALKGYPWSKTPPGYEGEAPHRPAAQPRRAARGAPRAGG